MATVRLSGRVLTLVQALAVVLPLLVSVGCGATCKAVCKNLMDCDEVETSRQHWRECQDSCLRQEQLYKDWDNIELQDSFQDQLNCLGSSTCEEIADGVCYDDDIFIF